MGEADITRAFELHAHQIRETFQILEIPVDPRLEKVAWSEVTKLGDDVSKQATVAGMLWSGGGQNVKDLLANMDVYFNVLHGFLLFCASSTAGAGPTLHACINASATKVIDCSLTLFKEAIASHVSKNSRKRESYIAQLSGAIWEACKALKKTPTTNTTAIGRAITQVAVSMKDVLREMKELKVVEESPSTVTADCENGTSDDDDDLDNNLSPEEMAVAELATRVVSDSLDLAKEIIRYITSTQKKSGEERVDSLERLLSHCQEMGSQVNELGACVYSPQEISKMKLIATKLRDVAGGIHVEAREAEEAALERLETALGRLEGSLGRLESSIGCLVDGVVPEMVKLAV